MNFPIWHELEKQFFTSCPNLVYNIAVCCRLLWSVLEMDAF